MKVVIFCGGMGTRLREYSEDIPKPLVPIGYRPILWHVMRYYAHYGHKDFILCLGYKAHKIKEYFLNYNEALANDFTLTAGQKDIHQAQTDIHDWNITFVDTGLKSNVGTRLALAKKYLEGEEMFLANYSDGLTNLDLGKMVSEFEATDKVGAFVCSVPSQSFHVVQIDEKRSVKKIQYVRDANIIVNGGYFVLRKSIFDYMNFGEELVLEPFQRLIDKDLLLGFRHDGFWAMDTFKEQQELTDLYNSGQAPWEVWKKKDVVEAEEAEAALSVRAGKQP
ncbi:MAG: glucose-1-phosphate cytidylyltransferase [Myxococcales bacterium]|nr:MAG: glucose-1-phosphate cytidylyltransferase [Myxococcales bacterium]